MFLKKLNRTIKLVGLMAFLCSQGVFLEEVFAQVVPDSSLGSNSSILDGDVIRGGAQRGSNLFHSFKEFSIGEGQSFKFANSADVTRIFSRVTGNQASEIKGTLGVLGNADLFLINPKGIIFGPNARLELKGSFIGTTADSVVFADGIFGASNTESSTILSVNVPLGLQISATAGQILNQSVAINEGITFIEGQSPEIDDYFRDVPTGLLVGATDKTLALIGGDILFENRALVTNFDGHIELGSVGEGEVTLNPNSSGWSFSYKKVPRFKDVKFSQGSVLQPFPLENLTSTQIQARRINFSGAGGGVFSVNSLTGEPIARALIKLIATESIELDDGAFLVNATVGVGDPDNPLQIAGGTSGNVIIRASELVEINNGSSIFATGNIEIQSNSMSLDNQSTITTDSALVNGGNIRLIISDSLILRRGSVISTYSQGNGGNIDIKTRFIRAVSSENSDITANVVFGTGGNINVTAQGIFGIEIRDKKSPFLQTTQKLEEQPIIDVARLIDQSLCSVGKTNELTISGRGGLPNPPQQALREDNLWEDWRVAEGSSPNNLPTSKNRALPKTEVIPREFQGWTVNAAGKIVLTAQANIVTPQGNWLPPFGCQQ